MIYCVVPPPPSTSQAARAVRKESKRSAKAIGGAASPKRDQSSRNGRGYDGWLSPVDVAAALAEIIHLTKNQPHLNISFQVYIHIMKYEYESYGV